MDQWASMTKVFDVKDKHMKCQLSANRGKFLEENGTILNDNAPVLKNPPNSRLRG